MGDKRGQLMKQGGSSQTQLRAIHSFIQDAGHPESLLGLKVESVKN